MDVAANGNTNFILSKESDIREKIKTFAEEKTGKKMRTPYSLSYLEYDKEKNMPYYELIEKAKETSELFNREVSIFNKNGEFTIKDIDFNYRFEFVTGNVEVYIAFSNLQSNSLKYINQKLEDLKKIKENLEI